MLTEREEMIVQFLREEAKCARHAQSTEARHTDRLYRMGQKDGLLLAADAISRGEHLKRPSPTIPASEWVKVSNLGH